MKRGSTIFLRLVIYFIALLVLALCTLALPAGIMTDQTGMYRPILIGLYIPAIPFFAALYQSLKILDVIDKNKAFSQISVDALGVIKYCAIVIGTLFAAGQPYVFYVADLDDAPGAALIGFVIIFASFVIATAAAVFQRLMQNAVDIKSENDLTV